MNYFQYLLREECVQYLWDEIARSDNLWCLLMHRGRF
jgi:hypothetical protein